MAETTNLTWLPDGQTLDTGRGAVAVTIGGGPLPDGPSKGIFIGTAGDVEIIPVANKTPVTFKNLASGYWLEIATVEVVSATASDIVAIY